jgi:hypothetical protein
MFTILCAESAPLCFFTGIPLVAFKSAKPEEQVRTIKAGLPLRMTVASIQREMWILFK